MDAGTLRLDNRGGRRAGRAPPAALTTQDVVSIKVVNQPDMDTTSRVETDGTIDFPYVGRIKAAGLSEDSLARTIERRLAARRSSLTRTCWWKFRTSAPRQAFKARSARLGSIRSIAQRI